MEKMPTAKALPLRQHGAVLLVSLVLLLIMTLVGVSSIEGVSMQTDMTRNGQLSSQVFNLALSEIEAQIDVSRENDQWLVEARRDTTLTYSLPAETLKMNDPNFQQAFDVEYFAGGCIAEGFSTDRFSCNRFEMNSRAQLSSGGAKTEQIQGLNKVGAF